MIFNQVEKDLNDTYHGKLIFFRNFLPLYLVSLRKQIKNLNNNIDAIKRLGFLKNKI